MCKVGGSYGIEVEGRNKNEYFTIFNFRLQSRYPLKWGRREHVTPNVFRIQKERKKYLEGVQITNSPYLGYNSCVAASPPCYCALFKCTILVLQ